MWIAHIDGNAPPGFGVAVDAQSGSSGWPTALLVVVLVIVTFVVAATLRRAGVAPETTRKVAHAGATLAVLPLAGTGLSLAMAAVLLGFFGALIATLRKLHLLPFLDDVRRKGPSEYGFMVGIAIIAVLGRGDAFAFRTAVLILGLCDAVAALVGQRFGRRRFAIGRGYRTLEGSFAFAVAAFVLVITSMAAHGRELGPAALASAFAISAIAALVEALSIGGLDNLAVPFAAFCLLTDGGFDAALPALAVHLVAGGFAVVLLARARVPVAMALACVLLDVGATLFERGQRWPFAMCAAGVACAAILSAGSAPTDRARSPHSARPRRMEPSA